MPVRSLLPLCFLASAACGDDAGSTPDAPKPVDAAAPTVMTVTCPAGVVPTLTTLDTRFDMQTLSITQGQIVKFITTPTHPVGPFPGGEMTDPGLVVPQDQTRCLMFTAKGTFKFICTTHQYLGTITVN